MRHNKILINTILFLCLLFGGCEGIYFDRAMDFSFYNNADYRIAVYSPLIPPHSQPAPIVYPDTMLPFSCPSLNLLEIKEHSYEMYHSSSSLDYSDMYNRCNADTISFFVISIDTLYLYGWDSVRRSNNILQRYDLSSEDCQYLYESDNDGPCFPPPPEMKNMKMWPPYGTYDSLGYRRQ